MPLLIFTPVSSGARSYGQILAEVEADLASNVAIGIMGGTTFARSSGNQRQVYVAISVSFQDWSAKRHEDLSAPAIADLPAAFSSGR